MHNLESVHEVKVSECHQFLSKRDQVILLLNFIQRGVVVGGGCRGLRGLRIPHLIKIVERLELLGKWQTGHIEIIRMLVVHRWRLVHIFLRSMSRGQDLWHR